jgi:hypothetical protein
MSTLAARASCRDAPPLDEDEDCLDREQGSRADPCRRIHQQQQRLAVLMDRCDCLNDADKLGLLLWLSFAYIRFGRSHDRNS